MMFFSVLWGCIIHLLSSCCWDIMLSKHLYCDL